jgi:hypothetical protein
MEAAEQERLQSVLNTPTARIDDQQTEFGRFAPASSFSGTRRTIATAMYDTSPAEPDSEMTLVTARSLRQRTETRSEYRAAREGRQPEEGTEPVIQDLVTQPDEQDDA